MTRSNNFWLAFVTICLVGCSDPLTDANNSSVALRASEEQGLSFADFQHLTQGLATQVQLAAPKCTSESERNRIVLYQAALRNDQDAASFWQAAAEHNGIVCGGEVDGSWFSKMSTQYKVPLHHDLSLTAPQYDQARHSILAPEEERAVAAYEQAGDHFEAEKIVWTKLGDCTSQAEGLSAIWAVQNDNLVKANGS